MTPESQAQCERLEWDSAFWGFPVGRIRGECLTLEQAQQATAWSREHGFRCLYFRSAADDAESARAAQQAGFRCVDLQVTFEWVSTHETSGVLVVPEPPIKLRNFAEHDSDILRAIARTSYGDTRFYFDGQFPRPQCDRLYEVWIEKCCTGGADSVTVAELNGEAVGYVTCHLDSPDGAGKIGLVGVASGVRGRGVGAALINSSIDWFTRNGAHTISVVTQGRNVSAQRLYQRAGFLTKATAQWFHWWNDVRATT
ncbi:MAG: GNAT family N-acetyltransferase [Chloroflexota bacterium]